MRNGKSVWRLLITAGAVSLLMTSLPANAALVPGRIAISSDGNKHDCDDIFATAVTVAILAKTGNAAKLSYYGYADHVWGTSSGCNDGNREIAMKRSAVDTARLYGGFDLSKFVNAKANHNAAVQRLTDEINTSSSTNPLWIIAAGPMQVIGEALTKAASSRRQYVTVVSHSSWNDQHADAPQSGESPRHSGWTWDEIGRMSSPPKRKHLPDQNPTLSTSWSPYISWRDSADSRLRWLWSRAQAAGTSWPDCSDAGMTAWLVKASGSDEKLSTSELKAIVGG